MRSFVSLLVAAVLAAAADVPSEKQLPLKPERKLEFTTAEGTWLSLALSPDGKTLVFDLVGHLYSLPAEGGDAKALTSGLPFDSQPAFSVDGKHLAFISDRDGADNLWIADADGTHPRQITHDKQTLYASPSWTADNNSVLVAREAHDFTGYEIWVYDIRGGKGLQVTKSFTDPKTPPDARDNCMGAAASPDGNFIYYAHRKGEFSYNVKFPLWQLMRKDRRTGEEDTLTNAQGSAFRPVLSPDGKLLAYGTRLDAQTELRIRNLETGEDRRLKYPIQRDDQESRATRDVLPNYIFSPDSRYLYTSFGGSIHRLTVADGSDSGIPFRAQVSLDLGPRLHFPTHLEQGPVKARLIQGAVASPDGKQIAFSALTRLYAMNIPGGSPRELAAPAAGAYQPAWSPDGQSLVYVTWNPQTGGQMWKMPSAGGPAQALTPPGAFYSSPAWTPDGSRIVALRSSTHTRNEAEQEFRPGVGQDVVSIPAAGGTPQVIIPAKGFGRPHFVTAEKDRVYVYSKEGLLSVKFDGTDRRTALKVIAKNMTGAADPPTAGDVQMSPDKRWALAELSHQLYLIAVPPGGVGEPVVDLSEPSMPVRKLSSVGVDFFSWADGGQTVTWSLGASFFRLSAASVTFPEAPPPPSGPNAAVAKPPVIAPPTHEEFPVDIQMPRAVATGTAILRHARTITMKGDEVLESADIVIRDGRIAAIGKSGTVTVPRGAAVFDLTGKTVMPGIIDVHAHWTEIRRGVLDTQSWPLFANLAYGVTTGRDPQTFSNDIFAYQDLIDMGVLPGPRALSTGPGIFGPSSNQDFQSFEEERDVVERYRKYYRTNTVKSYMVGNRRQREWMVQASKELQIMPTTEGGLDLKLDMTHALDGFSGNEHALPVVPLYKDVVQLFAQSGISYTPTLLVAYGGPWAENYFYETGEVHDDVKMRRFFPHSVLDEKSLRRPWFYKSEQVYPKLAESAGTILRAGGLVCLGGHGQIQGLQDHWEMWAFAEGKLSNHEVLRIATINGARAIGYEQEMGSLETGKAADLLVLNADPLENIRNTTNLRYVMKGGAMYEAATLDEVWPEKKTLPKMWWQQEPSGAAVTSGQN